MPYKMKEDLYAAQKRHRTKVRQKLFELLSTKKCLDCSESDPVVLDFDHTVREEKFKTVSRMLSGHYSWVKVLSEIQKCQVRCANCHRRKSYSEAINLGIKSQVVKK